MKKPVTVGAATLVTFALGAMLAVFVAGSAVAASTTPTTTTATAPTDSFFVVNGTANAASDHEIVASSAFPNYTNGAVDNYYALAHAHIDNAPFAQGTASPFDTGPVGQTAAAGNTQQPQYADARWPGSSGKAEYGNQGGPHAVATASDTGATADASAASNALSGPSMKRGVVLPKGLDGRLRLALGAWKAKWQGRLAPPRPAPPKPALPKPAIPKPTVTTPVATVTTPAVGGVNVPNVPAPTPVQAPPPPPTPTPTVPVPTAAAPTRQLASDSTPTDGESLLESSTKVTLVPSTAAAKPAVTTTTTAKKPGRAKPVLPRKTYTLVTSGHSSLGRVTLGGGQIVIEGIRVTASIENDGTPTYTAAVSVASATIGGIPVTIDEDGVHVAGQGQALPYQQASDALNNALKQAGIQIFLVAPEVTTGGSCGRPETGTGTDTTSTTTTPTTTDPSSAGDACGAPTTCDQTSTTTGSTTTTPLPTSTSPSDTTTSPGACGAPTTCDQAGTATTGTSTTTTTTTQTDTTPTSSWCAPTAATAPTGTCRPAGTPVPTTTTPADQPGATTTPGMGDPFALGPAAGGANANEETVRATGVHVVFTQPANQAGVPAQRIEHIFGEVLVDSLAVPGSPDAGLDFSPAAGADLYGTTGAKSSSCLGGVKSGKRTSGGGLAAGGGSAVSSGSLPPSASSASGYGSSSQPISGSTAVNSLPVAFATALRKPLWLLVAYLVWQALVIGTGVSLWNWRKGDA